ncbi:MAG: hypothetical protein ACE5PO_03300 [Candidatus Bathyarchaeia archaeon]
MREHNETDGWRKIRALLEHGLDALARAKEEIAQVEQVMGTLLYDIEKSEQVKE